MKTIAKLIFAVIFFLSPAVRAQQPLAGSDVRLSPQTAAPSNLNGRAGIFNLNGVFTWHTSANVDLPALACASCTNNRILYFNSGTGQAGTALIVGGNSDSLFDTSGLYGVRFNTAYVETGYNTQNQAATWGWRAKSNLIEAVTNGNVVFNDNGSVAVFAHQVENDVGGYKFPDGTVQTTAASVTANAISPSLIDASISGLLVPQDVASNNSTGSTWFVTHNATMTAVRFDWAGANTSITVKLWTCTVASPGGVPSACSVVDSATNASVNAGNGQTIAFSSSHALTAYTVYATTMYDNNLGHITQTVGGSARQSGLLGQLINNGPCTPAGPDFEYCRSDLFGAGGGGGGQPVNGGGNGYYAEPVFTVP